MVSKGGLGGELFPPEEGSSSTTQPYFDDDLEHLNDSGSSTPAGRANAAIANPVQSRGVSPTCQTPSLFSQNRLHFQINAAAPNSMEPCAAQSTSNFQINAAAASSREPCTPRTSYVQRNAAANSREPFIPSTPQAHCVSITSPPVSNRDSSQRSEDPLSRGRGNASRTREAGFHGAATNSLPNRDGARGPIAPVHISWEGTPGGTPTHGTGTEPVCNEAEHTRNCPVSRALFPASSSERARKVSNNDVAQNVLQLDGPASQNNTPEFPPEEGTTNTIPSAPNTPSRDFIGVSRIDDGQPFFNSQIIKRVDGTDVHSRFVFGQPQHVRFPISNPHFQALGSLDFTRAFQLLEILKGRKLEEAFKVEQIEKLKTLSKAEFKNHLLKCNPLQNGRNRDTRETWFAENPRFECCVNSTSWLTFKISEQREGLNALQRCFGRDRVLRVFFANGSKCREIMKEGIIVGLRHFQYYTHKDIGKDSEKKKKPVDGEFWSSTHCYFVCTSSEAATDKNNDFRQFRSIREARCYMMHIHTTPNIAKYISRLQLALSQTQPVDLDFSTINVTLINDIHCKDDNTGLETISTDGTGFISVDLAKEIGISLKNRLSLTNGISLRNGPTNPEKMFGTQDYPSLIQIRLFYKGSASKGTLLAHNKLGERTIVLRKSMLKVESDPKLSDFQSFNSLEICGFSSPPREAKLARELIVLLTLGGVPRSVFTDLVDEAIQKVRSVMNDRGAAWSAIRSLNTDKAKFAQRMLLAGIPPKEPFLQKSLMELRKDLLQDFRKGRVSLPDSCYLYGTADPTGILEPNQVNEISTTATSREYMHASNKMKYGLELRSRIHSILEECREHGFVSWPQVAVYKSPGKHPGDIHIFEAVAKKEIQDIVGNGKYVIFFSTKGSRSVPDEIGSSDLDGDRYFVTWNTKLIDSYVEQQTRWLKNPEECRGPAMCKPVDLPWEQLEDQLIDKFINARFSPSKDVGTVANWWLEHLDQYLFLRDSDRDQSAIHYKQALDLVGYFYGLVDSEKTGKEVTYPRNLRPQKRPHFQEKNEENQRSDKNQKRKNSHTFGSCIYMKDESAGYGVRFNLDEADIFYRSTTVLGEIYDKAIRAEESWRLHSYKDIKLEPAFNMTQNKVLFDNLVKEWSAHYATYNTEMKKHMSRTKSDQELCDAGCAAIYIKYRRHLYHADSLDKSGRGIGIIFASASAIYAVVYSDTISKLQWWSSSDAWAPSFQFAWRVAGQALCKMFEKYYRRRGEEELIVAMQIFESLFGKSYVLDIAEGTSASCDEDRDVWFKRDVLELKSEI